MNRIFCRRNEISEQQGLNTLHLVYLIKRPLSERDARRFGVLHMLSKGHKVSVIDLSDLIFPELSGASDAYSDTLDCDLHIVRTWSEFRSHEELIRDGDLVVALIRSAGLCHRTFPIFRLISKTRTPYLIIAPLVEPGVSLPQDRRPLADRVWSHIRKFRPSETAASILSRIPMKYLRLSCARYVVYNGTASRGPNVLVGPETIAINAHAYDYEIFIDVQAQQPESRKQGVFLDQYLPHHPDAVARSTNLKDANAYYSHLNAALDEIAAQLDLEIVVAAHPRADRDILKGYFRDRTVIFNNTAAAVAESQIVIAHASKATNFAILFNKPIYFLVTREIYRRTEWMPAYMDSMCRDLETELHFFDKISDLDFDNAFRFNEGRYQDYIARFIKAPNSPRRPYWEIVLKMINGDGSPMSSERRRSSQSS